MFPHQAELEELIAQISTIPDSDVNSPTLVGVAKMQFDMIGNFYSGVDMKYDTMFSMFFAVGYYQEKTAKSKLLFMANYMKDSEAELAKLMN